MEITINQAGRFYDDFPDAFCRGTETEEDEFRVCFFDQKPVVNRDAGFFQRENQCLRLCLHEMEFWMYFPRTVK